MVDIHAHILPGIDDGAGSWDEALEMAELAVDSGVDTLVCTPHTNIASVYENYDDEKMYTLWDTFRRKLKEEKIPLKILRGSEVFATLDMQSKIDSGQILPLNESNYYLVEFDFQAEPEYMAEILFGMQRFGKYPVLAHPERYDCVVADPALVYDWMSRGVLCQVNRGSLLGKFGRRVERTAHILLEHNLITCIASDAHSSRVRTTYMRDIYDFLKYDLSGEVADRLLCVHPGKLVRGERIVSRNLIPPDVPKWF